MFVSTGGLVNHESFRTVCTLKYVGWVMLAVPLLALGYCVYQYLYFSNVISTPLLPPSLAAHQPSHREDYAVDAEFATFLAAVVLGINLYSRQRAKSVRGFGIVKGAKRGAAQKE